MDEVVDGVGGGGGDCGAGDCNGRVVKMDACACGVV